MFRQWRLDSGFRQWRKMNRSGLLVLAIVLFPLLVAAEEGASLDSWIASKKRNAEISVAVMDLAEPQGSPLLFGFNAARALKPASILKIITSAAALEELGPDFRFRTTVLADSLRPLEGGRYGVGVLAIRGGAAPDLNIEQAWLLSRKIKMLGISQIDSLVFDDSAALGGVARAGPRAYQTGSSALSFNYNSVGVVICPAVSGRPAVVSVDPLESGAEILGAVQTIIKGANSYLVDLDQGAEGGITARVSGNIRYDEGCRTVYRSVPNPQRFFAETFRRLLEALGIAVKVTRFELPQSAPLTEVAKIDSEPLQRILQDLNHFSNNFIAEQVVYALGEKQGLFEREKGLELLVRYLNQRGLGNGATIVDGSGLDHENRLSAEAVARVLAEAASRLESGPEFIASLSVAGASGTLKEREFGPVFVRGKTGSLDGVSSLAGLIRSRTGKRLAFAIIGNSIASKEKAVEFEEQLVAEIERRF